MTEERKRDPVSRALEALSWIICEAGPSFGVREMASSLDILPSAAHRALMALGRKGLVRQVNEAGPYELGMEIFRLAQITLERFPLRRVALPHLKRLVDTCDETALLAVYDPDHGAMMFSAAVESSLPLRYVVCLNEWMPLHVGASGLAILSFLPSAVREHLLAIVNETPLESMRDVSDIRSDIEKIEADGYAISFSQRVTGAVGIAAPVFFFAGQVVGDVCITMPEQRFSEERREELVRLVKQCAASISQALIAPLGKSRPDKGHNSRMPARLSIR